MLPSQSQELTWSQERAQEFEWRLVGPFRGGRSCAVTGVPGQSNVFYFGSTGGGVWKTQDGGGTWFNVSDGFFGGSIGAVAVSESNTNVLYAGGGEKTVRGNVSYGWGAWRSDNGGKSWRSIGLEKAKHISRIRIHPRNENIAYAAVMGDLYKDTEDRGVYKTTDGGLSWKKVLFSNSRSGAVDLVIDPSDAEHVLAATWNVRRTPYDFSSGGEGSSIFESFDGGKTWEDIREREGLPEGIWGISGITISPVNPDLIFAIIENEKGGVFRSDDGGETWRKVNESANLRQRAWYYSRIYADTKDADKVYVMNVNYQVSTDGGRTFKGKNAPHGDHHDLWISPENPEVMIIGDDGGAQVSYDGGDHWSTYHNQATSQFYRVSTDNAFPYHILAAQQDNSTVRIQHRSKGGSITESNWESTAGGESGHIAADPLNPSIVYGGSYGGYLTRYNHETKETRAINVWPNNPLGYGVENMKYRFQWNFPVFFSPHNPKKLYVASNHLHVSTDEGQSWQTLSPDLTRNDTSKMQSSGGPITKDNTGVEYYCTIFAAAESPHEEGVFWVGTDDGLVHLSKNGGEEWTDVTPKSLPEWSLINSIEVDPHNPEGLYLAATRYKLGDYKPYLFYTSDFGKTWSNISGSIPEGHFTRVIRADLKNENILYAGTEGGLYISFNKGSDWTSFNNNLPTVPITDIALKNQQIIVATQGRSLWMLDDITPLQKLEETNPEEVKLFEPTPTFIYPGWQARKNSRTAGTNRVGGLIIQCYIPEDLADSSFSFYVLDAQGDTAKTFSTGGENKLELEAGLNVLNWDLYYKGVNTIKGDILWWSLRRGPKAIEGQYLLIMEGAGEIHDQHFNLLADPSSESTPEERKAQFDFIVEVRDQMNAINECLRSIRQTQKRLDMVADLLDTNQVNQKNLLAEIHEVEEEMTHIENQLHQTKSKSAQDPLNYPIQLDNKIGHIGALSQVGSYAPTDQALAVFDQLSKQANVHIERWNTIQEESIKELNVKFNASDLKFFE